MTPPHDEQPSTTHEMITTARREFLRSLGKWSQAVIGGVLTGGAVLTASSAGAASWYNRGGGWHNRGASWVNRQGGGGGSWVNRQGGGSWINRPHGWNNRGGSWVNRQGGGGWANRSGGWHNRGGSWINR